LKPSYRKTNESPPPVIQNIYQQSSQKKKLKERKRKEKKSKEQNKEMQVYSYVKEFLVREDPLQTINIGTSHP